MYDNFSFGLYGFNQAQFTQQTKPKNKKRDSVVQFLPFQVKNTQVFNGEKIVWIEGYCTSTKYNSFLEMSKKMTYDIGEGFIGSIYETGGNTMQDVSLLSPNIQKRSDVAKECGLSSCSVQKLGDQVFEKYQRIVSFQVKNIYEQDGTHLVWKSGHITDEIQREFLNKSKEMKFEVGKGLIGQVFKEYKQKTVDITNLTNTEYLRLGSAISCGLSTCTVRRIDNEVHEKFHNIQVCQVKNVYKFDGEAIVWISGEFLEPKQYDFQHASKQYKYLPGGGLIGKVFSQQGYQTVNIKSLDENQYPRRQIALKCGLLNCTIIRDEDMVEEQYYRKEPFQVTNIFEYDKKENKLKWIKGVASDEAYEPFLQESKQMIFLSGEDLIGKIWQEGGSQTVDVTTLNLKYQKRLNIAEECGLANCTVKKVGNWVIETFNYIMKNIQIFDGTKIIWDSGQFQHPNYQPYQDLCKTISFSPGEDLIGEVQSTGKEMRIQLINIKSKNKKISELLLQCRLNKCILKKVDDTVEEIFY